MSKNKELKKARRSAAQQTLAAAEVPVAPVQPPVVAASARVGFSLTLTFDPNKPDNVQYTLTPFGDGIPRDGDILSALQMTRDDILIKSAVALAKQMQPTQTAPPQP